jgi:PKD repeat protein
MKRIVLVVLIAAAFFLVGSKRQSGGCDALDDHEDDILQYEDCIPIVEFSADKDSVYPGDWVNYQFTGDLGSENNVNYHWILPGSNYNSETGTRFLTVMYTASGTYDATLIVSNECGADTLVKTAYIEVKHF